MSFFEPSNSTSANTTNSSASEYCENCSSNFTIFKRKKTCHICRQQFCQACVNRHQVNAGSNSSSGSSERICVICQSICLPQTTMDDLMKYKLKHLRSVLNTANVATNTCKEKRDLAELVLRNKTRINYTNINQSSQVPPQSGTNTNNQRNQQQSDQQQQQTPTTNNPFSNFMNSVQDFVNFNLVNNAYPMPAGSSSSSGTTTTNSTNNNRNSSTRSSSSSSSNSVPGGFGQNHANSSTTYTNTNANSSSGRNTNIPASASNNLNGLFNNLNEIITEQVPNVFNQTFTNNQFTFNNLFPGGDSPASTATTTEANNESLNRNAQSTASNSGDNSQNSHRNATTSQSSQASQASSNASTANVRRRASLSDIKTITDIENLTIKQIKEILACNFVDYKGCCEKKELVDKAKRLYTSYLENKRLESEINETGDSGSQQTKDNMAAMNEDKAEESTASSGAAMKSDEQAQSKKKIDESDMCKICMESLIDCVLLECGHMVSCIKCGKRLAECPMCRQNIVRVIRVFKS